MFQDYKLGLIGCLILTVGYLSNVHAVTDAELEALEKQIEQQELEEKKQKAETDAKRRAEQKQKAEAAAKRKTELKRKANAEAEKTRAAELEKQRIEEEKRLTEETKKREEEEKKKKYTMLITEAEQATSNKDKEVAISKYNEALALYPDDAEAELGIKTAEKLMDKGCYNILGEWVDFGNRMFVKSDGTVEMKNVLLGEITAKWKCLDSETQSYLFYNYSCGGLCPDLKAQIIDNGACLNIDVWGCNRRPNSTSEKNKIKGPDIKL